MRRGKVAAFRKNTAVAIVGKVRKNYDKILTATTAAERQSESLSSANVGVISYGKELSVEFRGDCVRPAAAGEPHAAATAE